MVFDPTRVTGKILDTVMAEKAQKEAREFASLQAIPQTLLAVQELRNRQAQTQINQLNALSKIAQLPQDRLIRQGKSADSLLKMRDAGVISDAQFDAMSSSMSQNMVQSNLLNTLSNPEAASDPQQARTQDKAVQKANAVTLPAPISDEGLTPSQRIERAKVREQQIKAEGQAQAVVAKEQAKEAEGARKGVTGTKRFLDQFERSHKELSVDFPDFGRVGVGGKFERLMLQGLTALDEFPETKTLLTEIKPIANQSARDVEGGRVTDEDRQIYADALANTVARPSATNVRVTSNSILRLADKGGDISGLLSDLSSSDTDVIQSIVRQVLEGLTESQIKALGEF